MVNNFIIDKYKKKKLFCIPDKICKIASVSCNKLLLFIFIAFLNINAHAYDITGSQKDINILAWDVKLIVNSSSAVSVSEEITFNIDESFFKNINIALKKRKVDKDGDLVRLNYKNIKTYINGHEVDYTVNRYSSYNLIQIPILNNIDNNQTVKKDKLFCLITYDMDGAIEFGEGIDGLSWTSYGYSFKHTIEKASLEVILPEGIKKGKLLDVSTMAKDDNKVGDNYIVAKDQGNIFRVESKHAFVDNESLSISISWPEGYIMRKAKDVFMTPLQRQLLIMGVVFLGTLLLCIGCFLRIRYLRDNSRYDPPYGLRGRIDEVSQDDLV